MSLAWIVVVVDFIGSLCPCQNCKIPGLSAMGGPRRLQSVYTVVAMQESMRALRMSGDA